MNFTDEDLVEPREGIHEFTVEVVQTVKVTIDGAKLDKSFMVEFVRDMFPCFTLPSHAEHIAQLAARGVLDETFTEGYGPLADRGIKAEIEFCETEVLG